MKLTKEEVAIMVKVRKNMQRAYDDPENRITQYICWNILKVVKGPETMTDLRSLPIQMEVIGGVAERLYRHIMWALRGYGTVTDFIGDATTKFGYDFGRFARRFDAEARLAWLDRIIEMEDIK